jgi:hypothetical protein
MTKRLAFLALAACAALAGCGSDAGSGELSAEDERRLDNAAAMLDDNMVDVSPDSLTANVEELEALEEGAEPPIANAVENEQ